MVYLTLGQQRNHSLFYLTVTKLYVSPAIMSGDWMYVTHLLNVGMDRTAQIDTQFRCHVYVGLLPTRGSWH